MTIAPDFSAGDYCNAFLRCLPTGPVWPRDPDAMPYQVALALYSCYATSGVAAAALLVDAFPATAVGLLPEWESALGLPDPCAGEAPTIELRRSQVVARLTDPGGCSIAYFVAYAAALGYDITIDQFRPRRFGDPFGQPMNGLAWAFAWQVDVPEFTTTSRKFGDAFGEPFATWGSTVLLCELQRLAPAHTTIIFSFTGVTWDTFNPDVDVLPS